MLDCSDSPWSQVFNLVVFLRSERHLLATSSIAEQPNGVTKVFFGLVFVFTILNQVMELHYLLVPKA